MELDEENLNYDDNLHFKQYKIKWWGKTPEKKRPKLTPAGKMLLLAIKELSPYGNLLVYNDNSFARIYVCGTVLRGLHVDFEYHRWKGFSGGFETMTEGVAYPIDELISDNIFHAES